MTYTSDYYKRTRVITCKDGLGNTIKAPSYHSELKTFDKMQKLNEEDKEMAIQFVRGLGLSRVSDMENDMFRIIRAKDKWDLGVSICVSSFKCRNECRYYSFI